MITKITSANDLELFAPRFQQITDALAITNDTTRKAVIDAIDANIALYFVDEKTQNIIKSVVEEKKVRSLNKDVLMDGFASALIENSVESLKVLYGEEIAAGTMTLAEIEDLGLTSAQVATGLENIEPLADIAVAKAREVGLVVDSLETYFSNLDEIKSLQTSQLEDGKFLLVMPADEPYFEINADTRVINIPSDFKKNGVGVYGDHLAELLVFKIDRYFDSQDFMNTKIAINWNFTPSGSRVPAFEDTQAQAAFAKDDELEPGYVLFGFFVTKEMTPSKGTLSFSVTCYNTDNDEITYSFNTQVAQVAINDGLTLTNPNAVKNVGKDVIARLQSSSYTPTGVSPIDEPVWQLGELDEEGKYLGLPAELNFHMDDNGIEDDELILVSQAYSPGLNTMKYTWYSAPENGNIEMLQEPDVVTKPSDYFLTTDTSANEESVYYKKGEDNKIISTPLTAEEAAEAFENAEELYELGSSYAAVTAGRYQVDAQASKITVRSNGSYIKTVSNLIHSNVCEVPAAAEPEVQIVVESALTPENTDFTIIDAETPYKFISADAAPTINAYVVSKDENQPLGAVAVEVLKSNEIDELTAETIIANTKSAENPDGKYEFSILPDTGAKQVNAADVTAEGEYQVRAINRRNHTYSVSEPSEIVQTSFVAPKITELTVKTLDGSTWVTMLNNGALPADAPTEMPYGYGKAIELNRNYPSRTFILDDNTAEALKYEDAVTTYIVEEVEYDDATESWKVSYTETSPSPDEFEVVFNDSYVDADHSAGAYTFEISGDNGIYRIRTENRYHGTLRIGYTDVFRITVL